MFGTTTRMNMQCHIEGQIHSCFQKGDAQYNFNQSKMENIKCTLLLVTSNSVPTIN